jgi:hypothetical protein
MRNYLACGRKNSFMFNSLISRFGIIARVTNKITKPMENITLESIDHPSHFLLRAFF